MPPFVKKPQWQSWGSRPAFGGQRPQAWWAARPQTWWPQRPQVWWAPRPPQAWWTARPFQAGAASRPSTWWARPMQAWNRDVRMVYINEMIKAPKVLLIDEAGNKSDTVISRDEALRRASSLWLDLVQVAYNPLEMICTAKIVDYWKYQYDKKKDEKDKKKNQKSKWSKDIKMSYTIWDNDLQLKVKKAEEFLDDWYTVRFMVRLKWRERIFVDKVIEKLKWIEILLEAKWKSPWVKQEPNGVSLFLLPKTK